MSFVNLKEYVTVKTVELSVYVTDFWQISVKLAYNSRKMASIVIELFVALKVLLISLCFFLRTTNQVYHFNDAGKRDCKVFAFKRGLVFLTLNMNLF